VFQVGVQVDGRVADW